MLRRLALGVGLLISWSSAHGNDYNLYAGGGSQGGTEVLELGVVETSIAHLEPTDREFLREHLDSLQRALKELEGNFRTYEDISRAKDALEGEVEESRSEEETRREESERSRPRRDALEVLDSVINYLARFKENYQFRRIYYQIFNYFWGDDNKQFRASLRDLITLFAISHSIEVGYGVVASIAAIWNGASALVVLKQMAIGIVISLPGFDPLCWILLGSFGVSYLSSIKDGSFWKYLRWLEKPADIALFVTKDLFVAYRFSIRWMRFNIVEPIVQSRFVQGAVALGFRRENLALRWLLALETAPPGRYVVKRMESAFQVQGEIPGRRIDLLMRQNPDQSLSVVRVSFQNIGLTERGLSWSRDSLEGFAIPERLKNQLGELFFRGRQAEEHPLIRSKQLDPVAGVYTYEPIPGSIRIASIWRARFLGPEFSLGTCRLLYGM